MAALTCPTAKEKLAQVARHKEFGLTRIATGAVYGVPVNRNRGFCTICHEQYVGTWRAMVKVQDDADKRRSSWR